jgi:hypothetical protein
MLSDPARSGRQDRPRRTVPTRECGVRIVPLAGSEGVNEVLCPAEVDTILIGRRADWTLRSSATEAHLRERKVVFPATTTAVGRCHLVLKRDGAGGWLADQQTKDGTPYSLAVNGRPATERSTPIGSGDVLTLGRSDGPRLRFDLVEPDRPTAEDMPLSDDQELPPTWWETQRKHARRNAAAFAAVAASLVVLTYWRFDDLSLLIGLREELTRVTLAAAEHDAKLAEIQAKIDADAKRAAVAPADGLSAKQLDELKQASWLVVLVSDGQPQPLATAFPRSETLMVTNAHVATQIASRLSAGEVFVYSPGVNPKRHRVVGARIHPAYQEFEADLKKAKTGVETANGDFRELDLPGAYDVALLELEPGATAGPVLPIAHDAPGQTGVGEQIAFAGYLLRNISGAEAANVAPVPHVHFGTVSALTNFFTFASDGDWDHAQLVHNTIPITGGASGSPIVNMDGEVIAIVSSGEVLPNLSTDADAAAPAQPSAVLVNYAQRIDLIGDLQSPSAFDVASERAFWQQQIARLGDHHEYAVDELIAEAERQDSREFEAVGEPIDQQVEQGLDFSEFELSLEKGRSYAIMAYSAGAEGVALTVNAGDDELASETGRPADVIFKADRDGEAQIVVVTSAAQKSSFELRVYRTD